MLLRLFISFLIIPYLSFANPNPNFLLDYNHSLNDKISNNLKIQLDNTLSLRGADSVDTYNEALG